MIFEDDNSFSGWTWLRVNVKLKIWVLYYYRFASRIDIKSIPICIGDWWVL